MIYNFKIPDENNKRAMKLFKKVEKVYFMVNNGFLVYMGISAASFIGIQIFNKFTESMFSGHIIFSLIISICIGGLLTSLYNALLNETGVYRKLCKALKCSVFVNEMDLKFCNDFEELNGIVIPELHIDYDVDVNEGKTAILVKIDDTKNKIVATIDNSSIGKDKHIIVPSSEMVKALEDVSFDKLIVLRVCQINKENNGYVEEKDIDKRLVIEEAFFPSIEEIKCANVEKIRDNCIVSDFFFI